MQLTIQLGDSMRPKWLSRAIAGATTLLLAATLTAPAAQASGPDTDGPVLVESEVEIDNFNLEAGSATVHIRMHITDATGVSTPHTILDHEVSGQSFGFASATLVEGTHQDGWWETTGSIPSGAADGEWEAEIYPLSDTLGNSAGLYHPTFFGTLRAFNLYYAEVINDVIAPTMTNAVDTPAGQYRDPGF